MKRKLLINSIASLISEFITLACSFILPRLVLTNFGSEYNGIVASVTQFLSFVTLLRGGVGGVTRAAMYKPLAEKKYDQLSGIIVATERFMRKISYIFAAFLFVFACVYPIVVKEQFEWFFTFSLVLILGISTFAQYYFGITYQMLLQADQSNYVYSILHTCGTLLNTILSVILINNGVEFRTMKLVSSIVFCVTPIGLYWYAIRKYPLQRNAKANGAALSQRWDAFAHQVAAFVNTNTDLVILTLFTNLFYVSIYSVYNAIASGIKKIVNIVFSNIEAMLGHLIAKEQKDALKMSLDIYEWTLHTLAIIAFTCTAMLIVPFVMIYTNGVIDTDYYQPVFGFILCLSLFITSIRQPYQNIVEAAGHFKQTRNGAIAEALINISISLALTWKWKINGVLMGTVISSAIRTYQYALYASRIIVNRPMSHFYYRIMVSVFNIAFILVLYFVFDIDSTLTVQNSYLGWFVSAIPVFLAVTVITVFMNLIAYRKQFFGTLGQIRKNRFLKEII